MSNWFAAVAAWCKLRVRNPLLLGMALFGVVALFILGAQPFAVGIVPPPYDKLAHAVLFGCFFLLLDRALVVPLGLALALPLLISAADELHQMGLPGRDASFADWFAGLCGVVLAAIWCRPRKGRENAD